MAPRRSVVSTTLNGEPIDFLTEPSQTLLHALRDELKLTGTKEGCGNGNCGACSVVLDGRVVNSCCVLAVEAEGRELTTIEGVSTGADLHPLQQTFLEEAALQCGICTPGFIIAAKTLLDREPNPSEDRIRHYLAGNLCRCTGYDKIIKAVRKAADRMQEAEA